MKKPVKYIANLIVRPLVQQYLSRTRIYKFESLQLVIPPEVFHPGLFFSTKFLLKYLAQLPLKNKTFLELGAGSGLISFKAAILGANVTATDINPVAIKYLEKNCQSNNITLCVVLSDLFADIQDKTFDVIAINPPYYKKDPVSFADHAWYCGENGEYFTNLFKELPLHIHSTSTVLMVLSDECDLHMISSIATAHGLQLQQVAAKRMFAETNFIFQIIPG